MTPIRALRHVTPFSSTTPSCDAATRKPFCSAAIVLPEPTGPMIPQMNARDRMNASATGPGDTIRHRHGLDALHAGAEHILLDTLADPSQAEAIDCLGSYWLTDGGLDPRRRVILSAARTAVRMAAVEMQFVLDRRAFRAEMTAPLIAAIADFRSLAMLDPSAAAAQIIVGNIEHRPAQRPGSGDFDIDTELASAAVALENRLDRFNAHLSPHRRAARRPA
jgi:hypothetical protein